MLDLHESESKALARKNFGGEIVSETTEKDAAGGWSDFKPS